MGSTIVPFEKLQNKPYAYSYQFIESKEISLAQSAYLSYFD